MNARFLHMRRVDAWAASVAILLLVIPVLLALMPPPVSPDLASIRRFIADKIHRLNPALDADELASIIVSESFSEGIDPLMVSSMIRHESNFRACVVSSKGAIGLMQILPSTAEYISRRRGIEWSGVGRLSAPRYNVALGVAYMRYLREVFDSDELALMAYNWGPRRVMELHKAGGKPITPVAHYVKRVLKTHRDWQSELRAKQALVAEL